MGRQVQEIWRFWAGPKEFPEDYASFGQQWEELNPGWKVNMADEDDLADFPHLKKVFDDLYRRDDGRQGIELYVQMADIMGYALVHKYGGIYTNCDIEPVRPLPDLPTKAWASYENNTDGRIVNAIIGAPQPRNIFWSRIIATLPGRYFSNPTAEMVETTGPVLLTDLAHKLPSRIHVFPTETFNSIHWSQVPLGGDASDFIASLPEEAIAVHHWGHRKDQRTNTVETATQVHG